MEHCFPEKKGKKTTTRFKQARRKNMSENLWKNCENMGVISTEIKIFSN